MLSFHFPFDHNSKISNTLKAFLCNTFNDVPKFKDFLRETNTIKLKSQEINKIVIVINLSFN